MVPAHSSRRSVRVQVVADGEHYQDVVLNILRQARVSVWIATANLKDVMVEAPRGSVARAKGRFVSITQRFEELTNRGVTLRILHASPPSGPLRQALSRRRRLKPPRFELRQCPRSHLKVIAVDGSYLYVGSANLTGAGLGAKDRGRRNFELGLATDDDVLLDTVQERFDRIWSGQECDGCRLQRECPQPLCEL